MMNKIINFKEFFSGYYLPPPTSYQSNKLEGAMLLFSIENWEWVVCECIPDYAMPDMFSTQSCLSDAVAH